MSSETIGAIDLHTHLLPHMDDGSKDTAMSLELLRRQAEQGVKTVCATSHFYAHEEPPEAFCRGAVSKPSMATPAVAGYIAL